MIVPILLTLASLLSLLFLIIIVRTRRLRPERYHELTGEWSHVDPELLAKHLSEAITFPTVSYADRDLIEVEQFRAMHSWMERTWPRLHATLRSEMIQGLTRVYIWEGSSPQLAPALFIAHQDVVPIGDPSVWTYPPFSGADAEGFIWGRGALDIKIQMVGLMDTVEHLLSTGWQPTRTIYLCFGHDEEIGGREGARKAAEHFAAQGIRFAFLLDEGGVVKDDALPGLVEPLAAVGVAEKGYADIRLTCRQSGGHSSMPPNSTALGKVARAVWHLERHQFRPRMTEVSRTLFLRVGPHMPTFVRAVIANLWLFNPLFLKILSKGEASAALVRTTTAPTMAAGSGAANVLPTEAHATVNFRILQGATSSDVIDHVRSVIKDPDIEIDPILVNEPSRISPVTGPAFELLAETIQHVFPEAVISPYLMLGGTDAIKYEGVCDAIYRFCPYHVDSRELATMHAVDERISHANIAKAALFYGGIVRRLGDDTIL